MLGALRAALDEFAAGFVIARADGKVLFANASAQEMMDRAAPIRLHDGFLQGENQKATEALQKGLRQAAGVDPFSLFRGGCVDVCLRASEEGAAIATLKALRPSGRDGGASAVAIVIMRVGALGGGGAYASIAKCYGLTSAETKTLRHFMGGGSGVADAARAFQISQHTVKSHLQNIFAKTKCARQPHLIKLVSALCLPLRPVRGAAAFEAPPVWAEPAPSPTAAPPLSEGGMP